MTLMKIRALGLALSLAPLAAGILMGCSKSDPDASTASAAAPGPTPPAGGPPSGGPPPGGPGGPGGRGPGGPKPQGTKSKVGSEIFAASCAGCHGDKGIGGKRAPKLAGGKTREEETSSAVSNGKGRMPSFKGTLTDDQIKSVAKYVATL